MKIFQRNFCQLFLNLPASEEKLFKNIRNYMSMVDLNWQKSCQPASKEDIDRLEKTLVKRFGRGIPSSYRTYLELMGEEDGGLLSKQVDDPEFWNYFKGNNMAQGAVRYMEDIDEYRVQFEHNTQEPFPIPPFWNFYYTSYIGCGWGFSPKTEDPEQIIQADGTDIYFLTHDTFSKFLFYCTYRMIIDRIWNHCTKVYHSIRALSSKCQGRHCIWFCADCPKEWSDSGYAPLVHLLEEIENSYAIEECWFSSQKEFYLFDTDDTVTEIPYQFARYIGCHSMSNLTLSMQLEECGTDLSVRVLIFSEDFYLSKQLVNEILKQTTLNEDSLTIRCID